MTSTTASIPDSTPDSTDDSPAGSTLALKEWGAVVHALLQGRQQVLLRKGGIHEKRFEHALGDEFVVMPTVAHSHAARVRPEHMDLLEPGAADVRDDGFTVRCGLRLVDAVAVANPSALPDLRDLHIWTDASIQADRVEFRPRHALHVLVVQAFALPETVDVPRLDAYGGCRSWVHLPVTWNGRDGREAVDAPTLTGLAQRVRRIVA